MHFFMISSQLQFPDFRMNHICVCTGGNLFHLPSADVESAAYDAGSGTVSVPDSYSQQRRKSAWVKCTANVI